MTRYAILDREEEVIWGNVYNTFEEAVEAAKNNPKAEYVRPVDEKLSEEYGETCVDFGDCHAFAVR